MPSLQFISQLFWVSNDCTEYYFITGCTFSCNLSRSVGKRNPLQVAEVMFNTCCNLGPQLAVGTKQSMQFLQKVEPSSTLCSCCKPKKSCETSYKEGILHAAPTCNFSCNAISTQATKKLAPCNTSCSAQFYFLQRFQKFFRAIASYCPRLQNFLEPLQVAALLFFIVADGMIHKLCYRLAVACFKNNNSTNEVFKLNAWSRLWKWIMITQVL